MTMTTPTTPRKITGPRAAAICGVSPYSNPFLEFLYLTGKHSEKEQTEPMLIALDLEDGIKRIMERSLNQPIERQFPRDHPEVEFICAATHGVLNDKTGIELKNVGPFSARDWGAAFTDEVPDHARIECQQQCACYGFDVVLVGALIAGHEFRRYAVERDDRFIEQMVSTEIEFMAKVLRGEAPEPDWTDKHTQAAVAKMYGVQPRETATLGEEAQRIAYQWRKHKTDANRIKKAADACKAQLLHGMGECGLGVLPDGSKLTRKEVHRGAYQVKASNYIDLRCHYAAQQEEEENGDGE